MPVSRMKKVKIRGICCALPANPVSVEEHGRDYFTPAEIRKAAGMVGTETLYLARPGQTAADLCYEAAERLIGELCWNKKDIDGLLFFSQTPDYILPATAFLLQDRLGLARECLALDINLGCSSFVYGLWMAGQFITAGTCRRVIVLVGDTLSSKLSRKDRSVSLVFGDGAAAAALEYAEDAPEITGLLYSDGSAAEHIIIPAGAFRRPAGKDTKVERADDQGNTRSEEDLYMGGMNVFLFSIREVPLLLEEIIKLHGWEKKDVDYYLLHQANRYMLHYIMQKAGIPPEKAPLNIAKFGNTSGATLPLLICDVLSEAIRQSSARVIMAGFGVGFSWGALALELTCVHCSQILYV